MSEETGDPREHVHHPRKRTALLGHERAEQLLLRRYLSGRMHHGWLLTGPRGIGKATLAYRLARFVLEFPDPSRLGEVRSLHVSADSAVAHRVAAGAHSDLLAIERRFDPKTGRVKTEIAVDDVRRAGEFFGYTAGAGGWRICVVDSADDLNAESANALLKTLEEPPEKSLLILVSHQPGSLLPTIRSRCIRIGLEPLSLEDTVRILAEIRPGQDNLEGGAVLARGSPGRALELLESAGVKAFELFAASMKRKGRLDFDSRIAIADAFLGRRTGEDFAIFGDLLLAWAAERAKAEAVGQKGVQLARAHEWVGHSIRQANALNLDRRQTVLEAISAVEEAAKAA
jgi:DNA polymerase-3 subunit delta'